MKNKKKVMYKFTAVFLSLIIFVFNSSVVAAEKTARLKYSLENDHLYFVLTPDSIGSMISANKSNFKNNYGDRYVAFTGRIRYSSVSKNYKTVTVYGDKYGVEVDTSDPSVIGIVNQLKIGDMVTVYGQVDSTEIDAEHLDINPETELPLLSNVYYPDKKYNELEISDIAGDGHVKVKIPSEWNDEFVMGRLTNNGVNGYQFFLNAIYPQNMNYPENFYMFYFNYETYLSYVKKNMDSFDIEDIEELIIKNILGVLSGDFKVDVSTVKFPDGMKLDYCTTTYKPADGNDYRLEFFFKNDSNGIVCMLYLYYPNDYQSNHVRDVSFVIQSLTN